MRVASSFPIVLALGALSGCGLTSQVRPTPEGVLSLQAAVGGPMVNAGAPIPLPLGTVGASYGIHPRADVSAHLHLTTLFAARTAGGDLGFSAGLYEGTGARPYVTLGLRGYVFTDFATGAWGFVESSLAASWALGRFRPFVALAGQLDVLQRQYDFAPALGVELALGRFTVVAELKWYAPGRSAAASAVPWVSPFGQGALGLVLGLRRDFTVRAADPAAP